MGCLFWNYSCGQVQVFIHIHDATSDLGDTIALLLAKNLTESLPFSKLLFWEGFLSKWHVLFIFSDRIIMYIKVHDLYGVSIIKFVKQFHQAP